MSSAEIFVNELIKHVPELQPALRRHIDEYDEILPSLFIGTDVTELAIQHERSPDVLRRLFDTIEEGLSSGDRMVRNLIEVSFFEELRPDFWTLAAMKRFMGPECLKVFSEL